MSMRDSTIQSLAVATCLFVTTLGTWGWQTRVFRSQRREPTPDSRRELGESPHAGTAEEETAPISAETVESIVRANPFSPKRRQAAVPTPGPATGPGSVSAGEPAAPKFAYKGQVNLGRQQRAIVENTTTKKTHFLEVGQEVAGFKVLDIAENRVVLSDPQTHEALEVFLTSAAAPAPPKRASQPGESP